LFGWTAANLNERALLITFAFPQTTDAGMRKTPTPAPNIGNQLTIIVLDIMTLVVAQAMVEVSPAPKPGPAN
jgi:hypothetical protein